ncbi:MAG: hypothetical protein KDB68_17660 [Planctomycetes bacterium]|nr:hypothetical protein [Planctomycetota bacterium]
MLFAVDIDSATLSEQKAMQFKEVGWFERELQRLVRANPFVLGEDLLILEEEFRNWQDSKRRIDLLALDREGQLVVIELKRTDDGGHMDLQALRYAAMVSPLTFDQVVDTYSRVLTRDSPNESDGRDPRTVVAEFIGVPDADSTIQISSLVRIILVAQDFSVEITTTVLWLNEFYGTDIRCIRMVPYELDGKVYLDVQQVIPLPEAQDYQVKIRKKEAARDRGNLASDGKDRRQYQVLFNGVPSEPLSKRQAALTLVTELHKAGVQYAEIANLLPGSVMVQLDRQITERDELLDAIRSARPATGDPERRFFLEDPLIDASAECTWVLTNQWSFDKFEKCFRRLCDAFPQTGVDYCAVDDDGEDTRDG